MYSNSFENKKAKKHVMMIVAISLPKKIRDIRNENKVQQANHKKVFRIDPDSEVPKRWTLIIPIR